MDQNNMQNHPIACKFLTVQQMLHCSYFPVQLYLMESVIKTANIHISHFGYATAKTKKQN